MTALALIADVVGCLMAAGAVRVWQICDNETWREERWH